MIINASIQVIPLTQRENPYALVDEAIALIQQSGLKYTVGSFSTDLEGEYAEVNALLAKITDLCYSKKEVQFLVYTKLHLCGGQHIMADDKTAKFR